ncbi:MAG: nuclear transport factor 2 family protein [Thermoanaerobaculia bacterium]
MRFHDQRSLEIRRHWRHSAAGEGDEKSHGKQASPDCQVQQYRRRHTHLLAIRHEFVTAAPPNVIRSRPRSRIVKKLIGIAALTVVSLLLFPVRCAVAARGAQESSAEAEIEQLERDRQDAFVRGEIDRLDRDTSEDYTTINAGGKLSSKPQMMQNLRQGRTKVLSVKLDNLHARVFRDTAVLTGEYRDVNVRDGVRRETHALFTRVFVRSHGRWQAVAYQQTAVIDQ